MLDLEVNSDLKAQLRELHITAAKEVAEGGSPPHLEMRRSACWPSAVGTHEDPVALSALNKSIHL